MAADGAFVVRELAPSETALLVLRYLQENRFEQASRAFAAEADALLRLVRHRAQVAGLQKERVQEGAQATRAYHAKDAAAERGDQGCGLHASARAKSGSVHQAARIRQRAPGSGPQ